ncbi:helix-turn-helix transcriptional regulator [Clostridium sporogenes]|nr:helix-turn-helix transcriptional regulator [Clostridium sporogenes]
MTISKTLKYERLKRGMTQKQFAELLGTDRGSIAHYENGRVPLPPTLKKFSDKLDVDLAKALMEGDM